MRCLRHLLLILPACALGPSAIATTVYKCTSAQGAVVYQDEPCASRQHQQSLHLKDTQPVSSPAPPEVPDDAPEAALPPDVPAAPAPVAMLPTVYGCVRATDGKAYLSNNGNPPAYQVPYGIIGDVPGALTDTYGLAGGGASAPELNRGKVTRGLVANHYVWVQDRCRELTPQETCHALRDQYDENEDRLRKAFKSDRPPLEQREAELQAQLGNC